ncbi:hypothetical protein [Sulfurimonas sp. HSL-1716]|uniref:hypothetical protein n=1 Tax=Hydrocurvibacter sulfurireducens TaxID=3131937 RepID=UPI0031F89DE3
MKIRHRFLKDKPLLCKNILIIGTFNPEVECNDAAFFYGRAKNFFWRLLPAMFDEPSLKGDTAGQKEFLQRRGIELTDLILTVEMDEKELCSYGDDKLQNVIKYNTDNILESLKKGKTKEVYFTRKSFDKSVAGIRDEIHKIKEYCDAHGIKFRFLSTPSRFYSEKKVQEWRKCFYN